MLSEVATDFDRDTAITPLSEDTYETFLGDRWSIGVVPNGGYSTAPIIRALCERTGRATPVSVTTHFYRPAVQLARGHIQTEVHRSGKTFAHGTGTLGQEGQERSRTTAVLGDLPVDPSSELIAPPPVSIPGPDECPGRHGGSQGISLPLLDVVDVRLHPDGPGRAEDGAVVLSGWVRFHDERPPDPLALTFFADAFPPAVLGVIDNVGWVPSLELTVHVRRAPVDGWIRAAVSTTDIQNDLLIEDVLLWDETGALVAQARQLAKPLLKS